MHRGRSSISGRTSLGGAGPLRVKQDGASQGSAPGGKKRRSSTSSNGRPSTGGAMGMRKSVGGKYGFGRPSARPSSGYGRSTFGHDLKDPRQLNSRAFMQREIRDIIEFLTENGYQHPLSPKILATPTTKDFCKIFTFIYNFLDPKFKIPAKPEDEIPPIFKTLKYPFTISKSSMFTIGTPHTWPNILGALHWLMCNVRFALATDVRNMMFDSPDGGDNENLEFEETQEGELLFNYYENTYSEFLKGVDTFEAFEQDLADNLKLQVVGNTGNLEQLAAEEQRLTLELQLLEQEPNENDQLIEPLDLCKAKYQSKVVFGEVKRHGAWRMPMIIYKCKLKTLQEQAQMLTSDNERFNKYLQELMDHKRVMEQKNQDLELQLQQTELENDNDEAEKNRLEHCLANQELSASDVQRLHAEMRQLTNMLDDLKKGTQELDQEIWNEEKQIGKKQEMLEQQVGQYNSMARTLKLIPPTAEHAHGIDYELKLSLHAMQSDHAGMMDFNSTIKPALLELKKKINEEVHKQMSHKLCEEEALEQVTDIVESKASESEKMENKLQRLEKDVQSYKENSKEECRLFTEQLQACETRLEELKRHSDMDLASLHQELQQCHISVEQRQTELEQEKKDYERFLFAAISQILEHKTLIEERIRSLGEQYKSMIKEAESRELPEPAPGTKLDS